jgi:NAD(P)H dehydrogenase (quinone)
MILVSGAAGKTGRAVTRTLAARGAPVRAMVRRGEQRSVLHTLGAAEVVLGDMHQKECWAEAAEGCQAIYHICPNMHPDELGIGLLALDVARSAGVSSFVYHSVLHPQTESMPHHWQKLRVEEELLRSGMFFTIMQPAAYMQNLLAHWTSIVEHGVLPVPYAEDTVLAMVDLEDVAEAAATVLTETGHEGASYELVGPHNLTQEQVARTLSSELCRPVSVGVVPRTEWARGAKAAGLGQYQIASLLAMFEYYEGYGFWGNPNALRFLLGREPTSLAMFVRRSSSVASELPPARWQT